MPQTPEAQAFLSRIAALPKDTPVNLDDALKPSIEDETELRRLFATESTNPRLKSPHVGLVDVFDAPQDIRITRARLVRDEFDLNEKHIMPLSETRRRKEGTPAMVADLDEFKSNWAIFTENSLSLFDWSNVVAAGGSVLACLAPVPDASKESKRALRKHFHTNAFPTSDVDLFLYGMTPEQAEAKIIAIYKAVRDTIPWDCTCIRTKHSISIHSQYPYRCVQIVLRLYASPAEILAGFDVDAPCCAYDGTRVWANPRSIVAMMRQCNTVDVTRRSPSYEVRLSKYSYRDFEIQVPTLKRGDIDPTIFERSIGRVPGLARLIVLERLYSPEARQDYLNSRRSLRGRPTVEVFRQRQAQYKGDIKSDLPEETLMMNSYDVVSLHIPYGPNFDARRINKLVYQTDLGMNSPFNPKNKGRRIHRHPAFFGSIEECMEDCCEFCPPPKNDEEKEIQEKEDEVFVRGRIQFVQEDPGRQSISGSFNPIDDGEWAEQAYIGEAEKFCKAISSLDRVSVLRMINTESVDVNRRDHVGRTPLQVAIISRASDIACDLINAGARMTNRLVDGRTSLHLVAQLDLPEVARKLLQRSAVNKETAEAEDAKKAAEAEQKKEENAQEKAEAADEDDPMDGGEADEEEIGEEDTEHNSSEDDWVSGGDDDNDDEDDEDKAEKAKTDANNGNIPEDEEEVPDVFDVNLPDWDFGLTPLGYAVIFGSVGVVGELLTGGADPLQVSKAREQLHPMTLAILTQDDERAALIIESLLKAGAKSSTADSRLLTIFHRFVCAGKPKLVTALLRADPNAKALVNFPSADYSTAVFPSVSAIQTQDYAMLALLLAHGAKLVFKSSDLQSARDALEHQDSIQQDVLKVLRQPVETALALHDYVVHLLVPLGAEVSLPLWESYGRDWDNSRASIADWVTAQIKRIDQKLNSEYKSKEPEAEPMDETDSTISDWKSYHKAALREVRVRSQNPHTPEAQLLAAQKKEKDNLQSQREYFQEIAALLAENKAKSWDELYPEKRAIPQTPQVPYNYSKQDVLKPVPYKRYSSSWYATEVAKEQVALYDELYQACWDGDNEKIQELCLPKDPSKAKEPPIQIVAETTEGAFNPLHVAIYRKHWVTARLILTIASAQELKPGKEEPVVAFSTVNIKLDADDSDADEDDEDEDFIEDEPEEVNFIDVAQRKATAKYSVSPDRLLHMPTKFFANDVEYSVSPINKAIVEDDFEAFVQIAELDKYLPTSRTVRVPSLVYLIQFDILFEHDRAEMLDEYIRRTGFGVHFPAKKAVEKKEGVIEKPKGKEYWGLNVNGKKRKDLATKGDPNAVSDNSDDIGPTPLVWSASSHRAIEILKYLNTERPLAAYRYYYSTNTSDKRARNIPADLATILPGKLGWSANALQETPLTAAVMKDRLDSMKLLFSSHPKLMKDYLQYKITFNGFNLLLRAASSNCSPKTVDFLLDNGVSPGHFDIRGWNMFHIIANDNRKILLRHLLVKLPQDTIDALLVQQSKPQLNTPLHIAVAQGNLGLVKILVGIKSPSFLLRDVNGFTPFHMAVKRGFSQIAAVLAEVSPTEALYMENAIGDVPMETASQQDLITRYRDGFGGQLQFPKTLQANPGYIDNNFRPLNLSDLETKLPALKKMTEDLLQDGRLNRGTKLHKTLIEFTDKMEAKVAAARVEQVEIEVAEEKAVEKSDEDEDKWVGDSCHRTKTLKSVQDAQSNRPIMHRLLIHIADVHKSVQSDLPLTMQELPKPKEKADDDDLEGEADEEDNIHPARHWLGDVGGNLVDLEVQY